jgi:trehalose-phosphatase
MNTIITIEAFLDKVKESQKLLLMLDYDGTLAPFTTDRQKAFIDYILIEPLAQILHNPKIKTVVVSGRSIDQIVQLWQFPQKIEMWGSHGGERLLENGTYESVILSVLENEGLSLAVQLLQEITPNENIETKPFSTAFHNRGIGDEGGDITKKAKKILGEIAVKFGFILHTFNGGLELKARGFSKGVAADTLIDEYKDYPVVYFGDDLTDEDAFGVVRDIGLAVLIGEPKTQTHSNFNMRSRDELAQFFKQLSEVLK